MMPSARVTAQAKVNLLLRVLARESSGYHSLETVFARIALGDEITVRVGGGSRSLDCAGPALPPEGLGGVENNLAYRAAVAYADACGWPRHFAIEVEKHIPVGGGLGGGSADAGAVLRALNALSPSPLEPDALLTLATPLGADVPFLTTELPLALAWGRGERLLALPPLPERALLLVVPPFSVATRDAYEWLSQKRGDYSPRATLLRVEDLTGWDRIAALSGNDFEPAVAERHPVVGDILAWLWGAGALLARMSGSGSTVFGVFESPAASGRLLDSRPWRMVHTATMPNVVRPAVIE